MEIPHFTILGLSTSRYTVHCSLRLNVGDRDMRLRPYSLECLECEIEIYQVQLSISLGWRHYRPSSILGGYYID